MTLLVASNTQKTLDLLRKYESRNVTFIAADDSWPIVWERAKGVHVWDSEGREYLDLTAGFGVAAAGHANPQVVRAGQRQMSRLLHAMGDVHPHRLKAILARELSRLTFERWSEPAEKSALTKLSSARSPDIRARAKTIFCNSGFESVEAALKTAILATGKRGVICFHGAYHGLGYGTLNATHRRHFRSPFRAQLAEFGYFVPFPRWGDELDTIARSIERLFSQHAVGAILVEPVQGRSGINIPPAEFLPLLRSMANKHRALLILDEIYTGFGRTGKWFACEHSGTVPDVVCVGKALTGGFPLSACVGRAELMDKAWPLSRGEAIHTSTFLGHPVGCAMALAQIREIEEGNLVKRSAELGKDLLEGLRRLKGPKGLRVLPRGIGLMAGVELRWANGKPATTAALKIIKGMLLEGVIALPEGEHSNVIALTPPLVISEGQIQASINALQQLLERVKLPKISQ